MTEAPCAGGARLMIGFHEKRPEAAFQDVLRETGARSIILFARNLSCASQARELIDELRSLVPWPLLIAVDQEGGAVLRLSRGVTVFPGNMALGATDDETLALEQGRQSGRELADMGFDFNLAPVIDLQTNPQNPGIGIRSLGADRARARVLASALVHGHAESDILCCLKHFPGKGAASVDAHLDLPVLEQTLAEFEDPHLRIFEELIAEHPDVAIMSTHLVVRGLDAERPATLSPAVIRRLLRGRMAFRGLIVTDCLEMGAIVNHWGVAEAAAQAAVAGHDLIPVCHTPQRQRAAASCLDDALADGRLDPVEHQSAIDRIEARAGGRPRRVGVATPPDAARGQNLAEDIAQRALHLFGDERGLLPIRPDHRVSVILPRPKAMVAVEEQLGIRWSDELSATLGVMLPPGTDLRVVDLPATGDELSRARSADRIVLFTWDASAQPAMRAFLEQAMGQIPDRLIVVHLRNPFDQSLVHSGITALTAFGFRRIQLLAVAKALTGTVGFRGQMPAPWV
ncbi:MAG: glycoside hydrolase family 3 protein [Planctomycetes bacterium]|nr:glycoside hydrolase family 3 protein [Planctomycetota bacterium]